jgi:23S rRNA (cytidine1920-2'-O)/16S rRNA (cytidine1409-2'-O)-methyltransferase
LRALVVRRWPGWDEAMVESAIADGHIVVDGRVLTNPNAQVAPGDQLRFDPPSDLAGRRKLAWAIGHFGVDPTGRIALDIGACTGGFTTAWLDAGASRVYAVDVGHGQLLGSLRQDPRVVNLERTNVSALTTALVPEAVSLVSIDVSYLSLASAAGQLSVEIAGNADLLGLVKPMFELRLPTIPDDQATLELARQTAMDGVAATGWEILGADECPTRGGHGAIEYVLHARRRAVTPVETGGSAP